MSTCLFSRVMVNSAIEKSSRLHSVFITFLCLTGLSRAQLTYQFELRSTGDVLATLDVPSIPVSDPKLMTIALLDPTVEDYRGVMSREASFELSGEIIADGRRGLAGAETEASTMRLLDTLASSGFPSWAPGNDLWLFRFREEAGMDMIFEWVTGDSNDTNLGDWVLVGAEVNPILGDCSADGLLSPADFDCIATIEERDAVLISLNSLPGDFDGDGDVAFLDFLILAQNFGELSATYAEGNTDLDGGVTFSDFLEFTANFGKSREPVSAVPEPTNASFIWVSALIVLYSHRRSHRQRTIEDASESTTTE